MVSLISCGTIMPLLKRMQWIWLFWNIKTSKMQSIGQCEYYASIHKHFSKRCMCVEHLYTEKVLEGYPEISLFPWRVWLRIWKNTEIHFPSVHSGECRRLLEWRTQLMSGSRKLEDRGQNRQVVKKSSESLMWEVMESRWWKRTR